MAKHVLLTGFEPFGGETINPSELVARSLEGRLIAGRPLAVRVLPVDTRRLADCLRAAIEECDPDIVICMGQAGGRTAMALERVAVNVLDFGQADNAGVACKNEPIDPHGPDARIAPLPFEDIVSAWTAAGIPGYISNSAGTYLCNQALYELLAIAQSAASPMAAGFVHVPYLPEQAAVRGAETTPSMARELIERAMHIMIETVVPWAQERSPQAIAAGTTTGSQPWIPSAIKEIKI